MVSRHNPTIVVLSTIVFLTSFMIITPVSAEYSITTDSIHQHIAVLAHDSLEGRQVGEVGEWKAAEYIQSVFAAAGLIPKGTDGYLQSFEFTKRIELGDDNYLTINDTALKLGDDFTPLPHSASLSFEFDRIIDVGYGIHAEEPSLKINDYDGLDVAGEAVLIRRYTPVLSEAEASDSAQAELNQHGPINRKIGQAIAKGAAGIFLMAPADMDDTLPMFSSSRINPKEIPIIYLHRRGLKKLGLNLHVPFIGSAEGQTDLHKVRDTAYNVVGYLPGDNDTTVIIGAHYDHLGWGAENSLYRGDEPKIHNGADDNGSGTAALLELARRWASAEDPMQYSMLFIAFTGEEAGILGSTHYAKNMTIDSSAVRMMINMDMVGRLKEQEGLVVFGTGSSVEFKSYFDSLQFDAFNIISQETGIGASDHTAFYNRQIPSLFMFTGAHNDYHRPSDDVDKIDLDGIVGVTDLVWQVVTRFDRMEGALTFQATKSDGRRGRGNYTVKLGVVPDFGAEVQGLKIDGVAADQPGERAGIQSEDIIIKMGTTLVGDIYDYMGALARYKKGDSTEIRVVRGVDTLSLQVVFSE
ncbi:MAG: M28 family peptidase [candidate division Zixibacteria bacterium]|nr:M28 family peptidase [candidate division Zixibacteria bacterium]MDH3938250.1 M28 family peptidase [candidate division Zixibacteria bacterium]MDH4034522.1 M28 family peptidase [candidate division Zixibacteria bacterium]